MLMIRGDISYEYMLGVKLSFKTNQMLTFDTLTELALFRKNRRARMIFLVEEFLKISIAVLAIYTQLPLY